MTEPKDCFREHPTSDYCGAHGTRMETCARLDALAASKDAELTALRERLAAAEKVNAELAAVVRAARRPFHRFPAAPPIIGFTEDDGPIYPPGYDPTRHAEDCKGCAYDAALAALSPESRKEIERDPR